MLALLGRDVVRGGRDYNIDVASAPHYIVAGATGQGKSVTVQRVLCSLATRYTREQVQFVLLDPKKVELRPWCNSVHFLAPHVSREAWGELETMCESLELVQETMRRRYDHLLRQGARNIGELRDPPSRILVVVDELAVLLLRGGKQVLPLLVELAMLGRAAGIHLLCSTQTPDSKVLPLQLRANIPGRIALRTATASQSRVILDRRGAETLPAPGAALVLRGVDLHRVDVDPVSADELRVCIENDNRSEPKWIGTHGMRCGASWMRGS